MRVKKVSVGGDQPTRIRHMHQDYFAFNFSFLTKDSKYNLDERSKTVNQRVRLKILSRVQQLSQEEIITVLGYDKRQGLEKLPEGAVRLRKHPEFIASQRDQECESDFWVFRLGKLGRVIGKKNQNLFYILSIDASFDQYAHSA